MYFKLYVICILNFYQSQSFFGNFASLVYPTMHEFIHLSVYLAIYPPSFLHSDHSSLLPFHFQSPLPSYPESGQPVWSPPALCASITPSGFAQSGRLGRYEPRGGAQGPEKAWLAWCPFPVPKRDKDSGALVS